MAVCMDDVLENALTEQNDEVVVLESIYGDNFHLIQHDSDQNSHTIEFNLSLNVRHPYEKVVVEAVIPVVVPEPLASSSDSDGNGNENGEISEAASESTEVASESTEVASESTEVASESTEVASESTEGVDTKPTDSKRKTKPGLSRLLSTKHWHIQSEVSELTPIHLLCRFPLLYPTEVPPEFNIYCDWLSGNQIQELSKALEQLWQENGNEPVVFTWAELLQNSSWDILGLSSHLVLREGFKDNPSSQDSDLNSINDGALELALLNIFEYDMEIKRQEFFKVKHTCEICFEEMEGQEFCFLDECHHFCCLECLRMHCEMHINSGTVTRLMCPTHDCDEAIPPQVLQEILEEGMYKRWERLLLSKTLDMMRDIFYCPRCNVAVVADEDESSRLAQCATCFFSFCTECQGPWHPRKSCEGEEEDAEEKNQKKKKKKKKKKQHGDKDSDEDSDEEAIESAVRALAVARRKQFMSSRTFISAMKSKGMFRNCPQCRMVIEKSEGCNYMTCSQCRGHFCWVCGKTIDGYGHFSSSPSCSNIRNQAFPIAPVRPPSEGELLIARFKKNNPGEKPRIKKCPTCSQQSIKEMNNNHLKCWSCKTRYCYQCGKKIEGGHKHFISPCSCKQHSDD